MSLPKVINLRIVSTEMICKAIQPDEIIKEVTVQEEKWSEDSTPEYININGLGRRGGTGKGD